MTCSVDLARNPAGLYRFMYLSIGAAILTIALNTVHVEPLPAVTADGAR
ncbi:hypothetical protein [Agromyces bauzanensis]|uniref:Uncharacterized protein n=1 Tax=Agromyces bauzanensis TaxID=1308924 RepID=A0A917PN56_9MICO|nr:hypothetical protein [Agromyces bauzanensis]GGJ84904.1 hypothetical protein GCM10011372_24010 [Agromyces bauzanensis]